VNRTKKRRAVLAVAPGIALLIAAAASPLAGQAGARTRESRSTVDGAAGRDWRAAPGADDFTFDLAFLGATVSWSHGVSDGVSLGLGVGGGAPLGFAFVDGDLSAGRDDRPPAPVSEIVHAALFLRRHAANGRAEVEVGPRVAWAYHPGTEYESIFTGVYLGVFARVGGLLIGPRVSLGQYEEEAGRGEFNVAVVPLVARFRLALDPGRRP
jgi:hypothetical protein